MWNFIIFGSVVYFIYKQYSEIETLKEENALLKKQLGVEEDGD